jgi:hypothetical protein
MALFSISAPLSAGAHTTPTSVYVTSAGAMNGMTDPSKDNQDSVKDLRGALKGKPHLALVDRADEAVIILTVQNRGRSQFTASGFGPGRDVALAVTLKYKDAESVLSASALGGTMVTGGAWKKAAGKIADQVGAWVTANTGKLD